MNKMEGLKEFNDFWIKLMPEDESHTIEVDWYEITGKIGEKLS